MCDTTHTCWCTIDELYQRHGNEGGYWAKGLEGLIRDDIYSPEIGVPIVAVVGYNKDFAAYIGFPRPEFLTPDFLRHYGNQAKHTHEGCAKHGDKISEALARSLFPQLEELTYRA